MLIRVTTVQECDATGMIVATQLGKPLYYFLNIKFSYSLKGEVKFTLAPFNITNKELLNK